MMTLFPITSWSGPSRGGASGTNWPFYATADRTHPFAAAIMAQEIYESRYKSVRLLAVFAVLMLAYAFAAYAVGVVPFMLQLTPFALAAAMLVTGLYPRWQQTLELRGQMIECLVRSSEYGTDILVAKKEALQQLKGYDQFNGWSAEKLATRFQAQSVTCFKWVAANRKLIDRIREDLAA